MVRTRVHFFYSDTMSMIVYSHLWLPYCEMNAPVSFGSAFAITSSVNFTDASGVSGTPSQSGEYF